MVIVIPDNAVSVPFIMMAEPDCPDDTAWVEYYLDGIFILRLFEPPYVLHFPDITTLDRRMYHLIARAGGLGAGAVEYTAEIMFELRDAPPGADMDGNGLPDDPLAVLPPERGLWVSSGTDAKTGLVFHTHALTWRPSEDADAPTPLIAMAGAHTPLAHVLVAADKDLLLPGETGLLVLSLAPDPVTLVGAEIAAQLAPLPDGQVIFPGQYAAVGVLVSEEPGEYSMPNTARITARPVRVAFEGVQAPDGVPVAIYGHPTRFVQDASGAVVLETPGGAWAAETAANQEISENRIAGELVRSALIAPLATPFDATVLRVTPGSLDFDVAIRGRRARGCFTVTNVGYGVLTGRVTMPPPFGIVRGGRYALGPGESQRVVIQIIDMPPGDYEGIAGFTGGGGANRDMRVVIVEKTDNVLGCGVSAPLLGRTGDALIFMGMLIALCLAARRPAQRGFR